MEKAAKFSPLIVLITAALLLLLISGFACSTSPRPSGFLVYGMQPIQPTPELREAYEFLEDCTGEDGDFERIAWFRADSIRKKGKDDEGPEPIGLHVTHPIMHMRSIILVSPSIAFHEIMHDLGFDHEDKIFNTCLMRYYLSQKQGRDDE